MYFNIISLLSNAAYSDKTLSERQKLPHQEYSVPLGLSFTSLMHCTNSNSILGSLMIWLDVELKNLYKISVNC